LPEPMDSVRSSLLTQIRGPPRVSDKRSSGCNGVGSLARLNRCGVIIAYLFYCRASAAAVLLQRCLVTLVTALRFCLCYTLAYFSYYRWVIIVKLFTE